VADALLDERRELTNPATTSKREISQSHVSKRGSVYAPIDESGNVTKQTQVAW
jgi:hypothetical protein